MEHDNTEIGRTKIFPPTKGQLKNEKCGKVRKFLKNALIPHMVYVDKWTKFVQKTLNHKIWKLTQVSNFNFFKTDLNRRIWIWDDSKFCVVYTFTVSTISLWFEVCLLVSHPGGSTSERG